MGNELQEREGMSYGKELWETKEGYGISVRVRVRNEGEMESIY